MTSYLAELVLAVEVLQHLGIILSILRVWLLVGHWQVVQDLPHLGLKAHVDHAIGLVHHHVGALIQNQVAVLQHVDQSTRRGNDNL